jgi:hypothetical protein
MRKFIFGFTGAAVLALTAPAAAQFGIRAGEHGVDVRIGDRDRDNERGEYRERFRYRDRDEWRERRHVRECDVFWRDGHRVRICRGRD